MTDHMTGRMDFNISSWDLTRRIHTLGNPLAFRCKFLFDLRKHEDEKKRAYGERVLQVEKSSFTPVVFPTSGILCDEADKLYSKNYRLSLTGLTSLTNKFLPIQGRDKTNNESPKNSNTAHKTPKQQSSRCWEPHIEIKIAHTLRFALTRSLPMTG